MLTTAGPKAPVSSRCYSATPLPDWRRSNRQRPNALSSLGAKSPRNRRCAGRGRKLTANLLSANTEPGWIFFRHRQRRRGQSLPVSSKWRRKLLSRSGVALSAGRTTRAFLRSRSTAIPMGRHELAWRQIKGPNHLRNAHRHIYEGRNVARRGGAIAGAGAHRNHGDRDDAGRGVSPGNLAGVTTG